MQDFFLKYLGATAAVVLIIGPFFSGHLRPTDNVQVGAKFDWVTLPNDKMTCITHCMWMSSCYLAVHKLPRAGCLLVMNSHMHP